QHIPFPCPDVFETLPWRVEVLQALMHFDSIGFQTFRDRRNFLACLQHCLPSVRVSPIGEKLVVRTEGKSASVGTYPIGIDYEAFATQIADSSVGGGIERIQGDPLQTRTILGVDRLDYTKGILERLTAFQILLDRNPELRGRVTMVQ